MNVVLLDRARTRGRPARTNAWTSAETEELTRLYRAKRDLGGAAGFAYGETDHRDPQFYVLGNTTPSHAQHAFRASSWTAVVGT